MRKEVAAYYKNAISSKKFLLDLISMILGIAVIILTVLAFSGEYTTALFPLIFLLGFVLTLLNSWKLMKERKALGIVFFVSSIIFLAMSVICLVFLNNFL